MHTAVPTNCTSAEDRALRESATRELLEARSRATDPGERQRLLERVAELNLEIARGIAQRFRGRGVEDDDLEQVACLGLMKAVRNYRVDDGVPFIGYAVPTIRGEVKRYFRDCSWTVRIPRRLQELQGKIAGALPQLEQELGREPTLEEIAAKVGAEVDEVTQAEGARGCFTVLSLDRPAGHGDHDLALADVIADPEDPQLHRFEATEMLSPLLTELDARDREILELRFVENWKQADIGHKLGISQMQVSRLLTRILTGLRTQLQPTGAAA
ncbi:SigB/SigF/SigG family RNA polymerase sigma factor [Kribbella sp. NPDC051770]|uniref:SigB/SigF/SigG family RNA polymerase sigma factor n=1 Tax=Kribbella sp. NPDC051770 TaxID=3155413 RepID=UPI0034405CED